MGAIRAGSFLFTDLVGSTERASRLGPAGAEDLRQVHFALLRRAIAAHGGHEVKNLGDGLMAEFPSVGAVLDGAVAIQQAVDAHDRQSGEEPLSVRIGVSTGDATEEDGDFFGEPVTEAARLCAAAQGGQILTTDLVAAMARRTSHTFGLAVEMELKGLPEPVAAVEVRWEPAEGVDDGQEVPLPARLVAPGFFVGRREERAVLDQAVKEVRADGRRRIVLLSGEPGMGKTTLVTRFATDVHAEGGVVLYGRCDEDLGIPYQPWVEALEHLVSHDSDVLDDVNPRELSALGRLLPAVGDSDPNATEPGSSDTGGERYVLYGAVTSALRAAVAEEPLLVFLDDLHWADKPTLELLRFLPPELPVLIVGTYRESDLAGDHPLTDTLAALRREEGVDRLALAGLDDIEVVELLERVAGHEMDEQGVGLAHAVRAETEGNPFFTSELLRHLAETGVIYQLDDGRWVTQPDFDPNQLPVSIREVVGRRIARLGEDVHGVLQTASVIGRDFDLAFLAQISDRSEDDVLDLLEQAAAMAVVQETDVVDRFTFAHALVQHTLYGELSKSRRARTHRRVAEAIEAAGDEEARLGELAHHWSEAVTPAEGDKAVDYARRAGEQALDRLAPDEAARWFRQGLDLLAQTAAPDDGIRAALLVGLASAQFQAGDPEFRDTALAGASLAKSLENMDLLVQAALAMDRGWASSVGQVDQDRIGVLEAALAQADRDESTKARVQAMLASELTYSGEWDRRATLAREAIATARRLDDPQLLVFCITRSYIALWTPDTLDERSQLAAEARHAVEGLADPVTRFPVGQWTYITAAELGDLEQLVAGYDTQRQMARQIRQPRFDWIVRFQDSAEACRVGDLDASERLATEALEIGLGIGQVDAIVIFGSQLMTTRWHQGRYGEIIPLIEQSLVDNPGMPVFRAVLALARLDAGDTEVAAAMLEADMEAGFEAPLDYLWLTSASIWAGVAAELDHEEAAAVLYDLLAPYPNQFVFSGAGLLESTDHHLGAMARVLGEHDRAAEHLAAGQALNARMQAPWSQALTLLEQARNLAARDQPGDREEARSHLDHAVERAERHGFRLIEERSRALRAVLEAQR